MKAISLGREPLRHLLDQEIADVHATLPNVNDFAPLNGNYTYRWLVLDRTATAAARGMGRSPVNAWAPAAKRR